MSALEPPSDMLAAHPETAYFWGRVAGDGDLTEDCVTVRTNDETAAERLAAVAGADDAARETDVDDRIVEREYAHDASITRAEEEFTVQVFGDLADRASAAFGLPVDGHPGGYRLDTFDDHRRQLLRGLLEGCGTVCFKSSAGTVGISFVHDDRRLLERIDTLLSAIPVDAPTGEISESSSGGYWFGVDDIEGPRPSGNRRAPHAGDGAAPDLGPWLYEGSEESGLFAPSRRAKLLRSLDRIES